jgi:hypothetical protein
MTMREKLLVAAAVANGDAAKTAAEPGDPEFLRSATANFANIIDAILTTLAEPDEGMLAVGAERLWRDDLVKPDGMFTAMINHVRSGK